VHAAPLRQDGDVQLLQLRRPLPSGAADERDVPPEHELPDLGGHLLARTDQEPQPTAAGDRARVRGPHQCGRVRPGRSTTDLGVLLSRCPATQLLVTVTAAAAVQFFTSRARRANPSFAITEENAAALADVVRRLEGLPLAVELVAARVRTLPPSVLVRRLDRALDCAVTPTLPTGSGRCGTPSRGATTSCRRPSGRCWPACRSARVAARSTRPRRSGPSTVT